MTDNVEIYNNIIDYIENPIRCNLSSTELFQYTLGYLKALLDSKQLKLEDYFEIQNEIIIILLNRED